MTILWSTKNETDRARFKKKTDDVPGDKQVITEAVLYPPYSLRKKRSDLDDKRNFPSLHRLNAFRQLRQILISASFICCLIFSLFFVFQLKLI